MKAVLSRALAISIPTDYISKFHHYLALSHIYCLQTCENGHSDRLDLISCCHLIGISPVILEMQSILSCGSVGFCILKGMRKIDLVPLAS